MRSPASSPNELLSQVTRLRLSHVDGTNPRVLHGGGASGGRLGAVDRRIAGRVGVRRARRGSAGDHGPMGGETWQRGKRRPRRRRIRTRTRWLSGLPSIARCTCPRLSRPPRRPTPNMPKSPVDTNRRRHGSGDRLRRAEADRRARGERFLQSRLARDHYAHAPGNAAGVESRIVSREIVLSQPQLANDHLAFFRWGRVAGKVLVTNDAGDWVFLDESEFDCAAGRTIADGAPAFRGAAAARAFCATGWISMPSPHAWRNATATCGSGPHVHVVQHCAASKTAPDRERRGSLEKVVDLALQSTSPSITFELQADDGEPLLNFDGAPPPGGVRRARATSRRPGRR